MRAATLLLLLSACAPNTPAPLVGQERQDVYATYAGGLNQRLKDLWAPRLAFRDYPNQWLPAGKLTTVVVATIDQQGDLITTDIAHSAGSFLDREAQRAISLAAPFEQPPVGLLRRSARGLVTSIPLQFTVTVPGPPGSLISTASLVSTAAPGGGTLNTSVTPSEIYLDL